MKRGISGAYHHVSQQHLKRYLAEFDFRYNERIALGVGDAERMFRSISDIVGKRLTHKVTSLPQRFLAKLGQIPGSENGGGREGYLL
jgi:hypothetical protein